MEIGQYVSQDERTVFERYLGLTTDMNKIIKIGESLPMLLLLANKRVLQCDPSQADLRRTRQSTMRLTSGRMTGLSGI